LANTAIVRSEPNKWLEANGLRELESLFRAITFNSSIPILLTDDDRHHRDASIGAGRLFGLPGERLINRQIDDFAQADFRPQVSQLWQKFLARGEHGGAIPLVFPDGTPRVLVFRDPSLGSQVGSATWLRDYALFLLDEKGCVAAWYSGAVRIYGYLDHQVIGKHVSFLYSNPTGSIEAAQLLEAKLEVELERTAINGHLGMEAWHTKKDGATFWANVVTTALKDERGELCGFATLVRDFTECDEKEQKLKRKQAVRQVRPNESPVVGLVFGEFENIPEANDTFLNLVGNCREELTAGRMSWSDLTPLEYAALDGHAQEVEWSPQLRQMVKTQNPLNGELSHGVVTQTVHERV
jgi:formate hydrogenlyase transcriptional activator